jgi:hypothetical protein
LPSVFDDRPARQYPLAGDLLVDYAWQPGSEWLAVNLATRSDYSGRVTGGYNYLVDSRTFSTRQLKSVTLLNPRLIWSPDGSTLLWFGTDWKEAAYSIQLWQVAADSGQALDRSGSLGLTSPDYVFVRNVAWLGRP